MGFIQKYLILIPAIAGISIFFSCTKKKTPVPVIPEPTKWEKIAGHYKVFDTLGEYLYDMDLIHTHNDITNRDSIRFENFDGEFTFTAQQIETSNLPMYVQIGGGIHYMIPTISAGKLQEEYLPITIIGTTILFLYVFKKPISIITSRM